MNKKETKPTLDGITKEAVLQATDKLQIAVRTRMRELQIPLNTRISIETRNADPGEPMGREIWVNQVFPIKRRVRLCYDELRVVESDGGFSVEQTIIYDELT